jgi:hypothetical protein
MSGLIGAVQQRTAERTRGTWIALRLPWPNAEAADTPELVIAKSGSSSAGAAAVIEHLEEPPRIECICTKL